MELIPEWAPNLHPMVVHFPIAILTIAIFFDFVSFFLPRKKKWWTEEATAFLYGVGAVAAIIVYYTGTLAADSVTLPAEAQPVLTEHADWAWLTLWFYGVYAVLRIVATWWASPIHRLKLHVGFFLLSLMGMYFLYQTGDHGAQMVFKHGVGVQAVDVENPVQHDHSEHGESKDDHSESEEGQSPGEETDTSGATSFSTNENGNWIWNIEQNAVTALQQNFEWLSGSAESVNAEAVEVEDSHALSFSGDNLSAFFSGDQSYETEQIDYYVDMASFDGTAWFVSHVQDQNNYDFVSIASGGTVKQGRMINGEPQIFEEGSVDVSQLLFVRVVGNGTHFRGYINEEMVVHGHGDAPKPGRIGLKMNGSGTLLLQKMSVTQL
ncbi:DUF2231 domain-containing protein [Fodinibius salsisoli]|uniref:DUF2231 domain-containing protein n=1 Tax=Fodinibius salsisoli TaxID=2820877 RepID=A0ABT3PKF7_9BACT|nr:DUF2231 domain-containing protein [Fodinibius salsisoli]MCW9706238.1 DUF2231 domain-containing protein [Fodinibius salsisoli]